MLRQRWSVVALVSALLVLGVLLAFALGSDMPSEFLAGVNRPVAVTFLGMVPVLLVVVVVGCVLAYRKLVALLSRSSQPRARKKARRGEA
jgi:hypothetical protein